MTRQHDWKQMTMDLLAANFTYYAIAKRCCDFDNNKVKRWAAGKSIPNADEGPALVEMHAEYVSRETHTSRTYAE